jgi:hypothetical protein
LADPHTETRCVCLQVEYSFIRVPTRTGDEMRRLLRELWGQERARGNARAACTELSRLRVERAEVELFLERHAERMHRTA